MIVWQNGVLLEEDEVRFSPFDPGVTAGEGVFETILAVNGDLVWWAEHRARLGRSAAIAGVDVSSEVDFERGALEVLAANPECAAHARVRLSITGGGQMLITAIPCGRGGEDIVVVTAPNFPVNERSPLVGAKTLSYAENSQALAYAREKGADEVLRSNLAGNLCEGAISNVFFRVGKRWCTPSLETGCLPGIVRAKLIERLEAEQGEWAMDEILSAQEVVFCNSIRLVRRVATLDGRHLVDRCHQSWHRIGALWHEVLA